VSARSRLAPGSAGGQTPDAAPRASRLAPAAPKRNRPVDRVSFLKSPALGRQRDDSSKPGFRAYGAGLMRPQKGFAPRLPRHDLGRAGQSGGKGPSPGRDAVGPSDVCGAFSARLPPGHSRGGGGAGQQAAAAAGFGSERGGAIRPSAGPFAQVGERQVGETGAGGSTLSSMSPAHSGKQRSCTAPLRMVRGRGVFPHALRLLLQQEAGGTRTPGRVGPCGGHLLEGGLARANDLCRCRRAPRWGV